MLIVRSVLATLLLVLGFSANALTSIPAPGARVTDLTSSLDAAAVERLAAPLEALEAKTTAQVVVLLVPSLTGETIEEYAQRVFEAWGPGRKGSDHAALIVVAKGDRKMRIHTGRGLEGAIPDALAKRIITNEMAPSFKAGNFEEGLTKAIASLSALVKAEGLQPVAEQAEREAADGPASAAIHVFALFLLVLGSIVTFAIYSEASSARRSSKMPQHVSKPLRHRTAYQAQETAKVSTTTKASARPAQGGHRPKTSRPRSTTSRVNTGSRSSGSSDLVTGMAVGSMLSSSSSESSSRRRSNDDDSSSSWSSNSTSFGGGDSAGGGASGDW